MAISQNIRNGLMTGDKILTVKSNVPDQYGTRQKRYFENETTLFLKEYAKYSSDFFEAQAQGLDVDNPKEWRTVHIRMADIVKPSATLTHKFDESKIIIFAERDIDYVPEGTKIVTIGNTWLATNPANISAGSGQGVVDRCNAVWNFLDYYGNVISEPIVVKKLLASANDSDYQMGVLVTKGYFNIVCQYNEYTSQLNTNSRIILGSAAYRITGYSDFNQEFTGDYSKVRLLEFTARYEEPNETDDMVRHIAGGQNFQWRVAVDAPDTLKVGDTANISVTSTRNGEIVTPNYAHMFNYLYESSKENVATIDENGKITAIGVGTTAITVKLAQNQNWGRVVTLSVQESETGSRIEFTTSVPQYMSVMQTAEIGAQYYVDGVPSGTVAWTFTGADENAYGVVNYGNRVRLTCYKGSSEYLTVTATANDKTISAHIKLKGI